MSTPAAQLMASQVTEKAFLQQVKDYARLRGWRVYHTYDSRRSDPGFPDLVMVRQGYLIFAELKRESGRETVAQRDWLNALRAAAGPFTWVEVWHPSDWPEIEQVLR